MRRSLRTRLRPRLTAANVASTLCLFASLGGGAYAATQIDGATLNERSVTGAKLKQGAVTGTELAGAFLHPSYEIVNGDLRDSWAAPHLKKPQLTFVKQNPGTSPDVCAKGDTAIFCAAWRNYGAPFGPVAFWRDAYGRVHLFGEMTANNPLQEAAFVLPVGYRPKKTVEFSVARQDNPDCTSNCDSSEEPVVTIDPNGVVTEPYGSKGDGVSLEGIEFNGG